MTSLRFLPSQFLYTTTALCSVAVFFIFEVMSAWTFDGTSFGIQVAVMRAVSFTVFLIPILALKTNLVTIGSLLFCYTLSGLALSVSILLAGLGWLTFPFGRFERFIDIELLGVQFNRTGGLLYDYGDVALLLGITVATLLKKQISSKKFVHSLPILAVLALVISAAAVTYSRNVWLACALSMFTMLVLEARKTRSVKIVFAACLSLVVVPATLVFNFEYFLEFRMSSIESRLNQIRYAVELIGDNFFTGAGIVGAKMFSHLAIHNNFLLAISRAGLGGVLFSCLIFWMAYIFLTSSMNREPVVTASFVIFFITGLFYPAISNGTPIIWFSFGIFVHYSAIRGRSVVDENIDKVVLRSRAKSY